MGSSLLVDSTLSTSVAKWLTPSQVPIQVTHQCDENSSEILPSMDQHHDLLLAWWRRWVDHFRITGGPCPLADRHGRLTPFAAQRVEIIARFIREYDVSPDRYAPRDPESEWVSREACPACAIGGCTFVPHLRPTAGPAWTAPIGTSASCRPLPPGGSELSTSTDGQQ